MWSEIPFGKCQKKGHLARVFLHKTDNINQLDDSMSTNSDENMGNIN